MSKYLLGMLECGRERDGLSAGAGANFRPRHSRPSNSVTLSKERECGAPISDNVEGELVLSIRTSQPI